MDIKTRINDPVELLARAKIHPDLQHNAIGNCSECGAMNTPINRVQINKNERKPDVCMGCFVLKAGYPTQKRPQRLMSHIIIIDEDARVQMHTSETSAAIFHDDAQVVRSGNYWQTSFAAASEMPTGKRFLFVLCNTKSPTVASSMRFSTGQETLIINKTSEFSDNTMVRKVELSLVRKLGNMSAPKGLGISERKRLGITEDEARQAEWLMKAVVEGGKKSWE